MTGLLLLIARQCRRLSVVTSAAARRREISVRLSSGGAARLIRQFLTEVYGSRSRVGPSVWCSRCGPESFCSITTRPVQTRAYDLSPNRTLLLRWHLRLPPVLVRSGSGHSILAPDLVRALKTKWLAAGVATGKNGLVVAQVALSLGLLVSRVCFAERRPSGEISSAAGRVTKAETGSA
jgi:hypothetical protein